MGRPFKAAIFRDHLRSGGTEKQFSILVPLLTNRGQDIWFFTLFPGNHFWDRLSARDRPSLLALLTRRLGEKARERSLDIFSLETCAYRTEDLFRRVFGKKWSR